MAIQQIITKELGTAKCENMLQGSFFIEELTELVEKLSSMGLNFGMDTTKIMAEEG